MSNAGFANPDAATSASNSSFIASLSTNMVAGGAQLLIFILIRAFVKAVYEPRTYIPPKDHQAQVLGRHVLWPLWKIIRSDSIEILHKTGVDPYVFVRFLHMMAKALIPIWFLSWAVLLPINSVGMNTGRTGLDQLTSGNITQDQTNRYWAHLILDYIFIFWIMYLMWGEMQHWLVVRQKFLIDSEHSKLPQANTVLVRGIPQELLDEEKLSQLFAHLPGGVQRIWLNRDLKELPKLHERRDKASRQLENAQVGLIKFAGKYWSKREHKIQTIEKKHQPLPEKLAKPINADLLAPFKPTNSTAGPASQDDSSGEDATPKYLSPDDLGRADQLVPRHKRPSHRIKPHWAPFGLGWLGIGKKVDTIDWARNEIAECSAGLEEGRQQLRVDVASPGTEDDFYPPLNSAFIYFNQQIAAHMAEQILLHHKPYSMAESYVEQSPENVIWFNLNLGAYQLSLRRAVSVAVTTGFIVLWVFPTAFIGALSSVTSLTEEYTWMAWIRGDSPGKRVLQGVITGILPPILLPLINMLLPSVLRVIITYQGTPTKKAVELDLMTRYFVFLVVHNFFVITLATAALNSIPDLVSDPISVPVILSTQMPQSSTFFITLILTQFTGTMGTLLQPISLAFYYIRVILGGGTPRSVFNSRYRLSRLGWGQQFPAVTVYAVIILAYMVISPLITGFGACFFLVAGTVFKYLFTWVYDQPSHEESGGLFFPKAITHVFVGMYIQEIALCAFFFLLRNENLNAAAIPQGALMVVLIVITAGVHYTIVKSYKPLINALPLSLAHLSYGMPKNQGPSASIIDEDGNGGGNESGNGRAEQRSLRSVKSKHGLTASASAATTTGSHGVDLKRPASPISQIDTPLIGEKEKEKAGRSSNEQPAIPMRRPGQLDVPVPSPSLGLDGATGHGQVHGYKTVDHTPAQDTVPGPPRDSVSVRSLSRSTRMAREDDSNDTRMESHELATFTKPSTSLEERDVEAQRPAGKRKENIEPNQEAETDAEADNPFFALPGGPGVRPVRHVLEGDPDAFLHPASKNPQMVIWLPRDVLGLCDAEVQKNRECGVASSSRHAVLHEDGKVRISGRPPGDV